MSGIEKFSLGGSGGYRGAIHVGLVNNMPDAAMRATELQFAGLLKEAAGALDVQLHLFSLADIARGEMARSRMEGFYADAATLPMAGLDALIVTGAEPRTDDLREEAFWDGLAHLVDWAEIGTISTLFSCLAAHAAVQHLDGIVRQRLPRKLSGVFMAERVSDDPLLAGQPARMPVPHSRRNTISEEALQSAGYRILSRLGDGQANSFARTMSGRSLFLFLQGHPEYGSETLGREYLRDMGRYLRGESPERPALPENYFDRATEMRLAELDGEIRDSDNLGRYQAIIAAALPLQSWRSPTIRMIGTWLGLIAAEKMRREGGVSRRRLRA